MAFGCAVDVLAAFTVTFAIPYLIKPQYANLGAKVAFIFGGFVTFYFIWAIFCLPEVKGRSLEEIEELFQEDIKAWNFSKYKTKGLSGRVAHHDLDAPQDKSLVQEVEATCE